MIGQVVAHSRNLNAHHPEWWVAGLAGMVWCMVVLGAWLDAGHIHHSPPPDYAQRYMHWMIMVVAMMAPLVLESARITAVRSFWKRRHRAMALFLSGYLAVWAMWGMPVALLKPSLLLAGFALVLAAVWFQAPARRRMRMGCHLTIPMAPRGWRADASCLLFGWKIGVRCAGNCGILMVACAALGHALPCMVLVALLAMMERRRPLNSRLVATALGFSGAALMAQGVITWLPN